MAANIKNIPSVTVPSILTLSYNSITINDTSVQGTLTIDGYLANLYKKVQIYNNYVTSATINNIAVTANVWYDIETKFGRNVSLSCYTYFTDNRLSWKGIGSSVKLSL